VAAVEAAIFACSVSMVMAAFSRSMPSRNFGEEFFRVAAGDARRSG